MRRIKKGFTLIELLIIISIIGILSAIILPCLARAREQAKVAVVNIELYQISLALEMYFDDFKKYPPTREDCHMGTFQYHLFQLPHELTECGYLPSTNPTDVMSTVMEDRFNSGRTYKYRSVGECIRDRNSVSSVIRSRLWVPDGFPATSSVDLDKGQWYDDPDKSPVTWTLFSLGPNFDEQWVRDMLRNRYPVPKEVWYDSSKSQGLIVRMRLNNGSYKGSFER